MTLSDLSEMHPFHGYQSSIMPLSSGHYFYVASWDSSPTRFPRFANVWLVTPDDRRLLFSDPPDSSEIVSIYHDFDEIHGAAITAEWVTDRRFGVRCASPDGGYELDAWFDTEEPAPARALVAIGGGPPTRFRASAPVVAVSNFLLNSLVAKGGAVITGVTETGQPFYHGNTEHLYRVVGGSVRLNGAASSLLVGPGRPIEFGDALPYVRPVIKKGTLYLPFEDRAAS